MEELRVSYMEMHNILKIYSKDNFPELRELLATYILDKYPVQNIERTTIVDKLRSSFMANYMKRWKESRKTLLEFESKNAEWLDGFFHPFKRPMRAAPAYSGSKYNQFLCVVMEFCFNFVLTLNFLNNSSRLDFKPDHITVHGLFISKKSSPIPRTKMSCILR